MRVPSLRTVGNAAGILLLLVAVVLALLLVAPGLVGAEGSYVVQSDSMSPAIDAGDVVVVRAVDASDLTVGSVVTFRSTDGGRGLVTHRIVDVRQTNEGVRYTTKGDANEEADQRAVRPAQIVGVVWFNIPLVGHVVAFAGTDIGLLTLVVVPAILLFAGEVWDLYRVTTGEEDVEEGDPS